MAVRMHPGADLLVDYSTGGLSPALCVSVSAHLHFCEKCRMQAEQLTDIGGNLLDSVEPMALSCAVDDFLDRLDEGEEAVAVKPLPELEGEDNLIPPLVKRLIPDGTPHWQFLSPALRVAKIPVGEDRFELALHKIKKGGKVPEHDHGGLEVTVVLQGSFSDGDGVYQEGDFIVREPGDQHRPTASQNGSCICLSVLEAPIRLTGSVKRLLNPFFSITPQ